jgi:hypothetical protein
LIFKAHGARLKLRRSRRLRRRQHERPRKRRLSEKLGKRPNARQMRRPSRNAEEDAKRKADEEARRTAEEEARRKADEDARRKADEDARRKAEEDAKRKAEEDARRKVEEDRRRAEAEARDPAVAVIPGSGQSFRDRLADGQPCPMCPELVVVPAGSFKMGSPASDPDRKDDEGPQHEVTLAKPFAVGRFAVTFDEWDACVADGGCNNYRPKDEGWGLGSRPVINVSWTDTQSYINRLARNTGTLPATKRG